MRLLIKISFLSILITWFISCDSDKSPVIVVATVSNIELSDIANNGNGSDLLVRFDPASNESMIQEYKLFIVKNGDVPGFNLSSANQVSPANLVTIFPNNQEIEVLMPAQTLATDGTLLVEGQPYRAFVMSVATDPNAESALSLPSGSITLAQTDIVLTVTDQLPGSTGGISVDQDGNIYVADIGPAPARNGSVIYKVLPDGSFSIFASGNALNGAAGNVFDANGNLYQSNISGNVITKITPDGTISEFTSVGISAPVGITIDPNGDFYVANCGNNTIRKITSDGTSTQFASSSLLSCPNGIAIGDDGTVYVSNFNNGLVLQITDAGVVTTLVDVPGGNNGHLIFHSGRLLVVGRGNHTIYSVSLSGNVSTFAGNGLRGHKDGATQDATFSLPNDIAISPDGTTIYINEVLPVTGSDNFPSVLRKVIYFDSKNVRSHSWNILTGPHHNIA